MVSPSFVHGGLHELILKERAMQIPRYAVGETVLYNERHLSGYAWKAPYVVLAIVQSMSVEPQYRIGSCYRSQERLAGEHELCRTPQPLCAFRPLLGKSRDDASGMDPANLNLPLHDDHLSPRRFRPAAGGTHV